MEGEEVRLEEQDRVILRQLQQDAKVKLQALVDMLGISRSSVHYRIRKLRDAGVIKGFFAAVDPKRAGYRLQMLSLVRAAHGKGASRRLGEKLGDIRGVWAVYQLLGDVDYVVLSRAKNREDLERIAEAMRGLEEVERCSSYLILEAVKEDHRVEV